MKTRKSFWYKTSALSTVVYHSTICLRRVVRSTACESFAGDTGRALPLPRVESVLIASPPFENNHERILSLRRSFQPPHQKRSNVRPRNSKLPIHFFPMSDSS